MKNSLALLILAAALLSACSTAHVSEAEMRAEYERIAARVTDKEYNVRHILVEHRWQAEIALTRIRAGESFGAVARDLSQDPGSAPEGGEMGWNGPKNFVDDFSDAMVRLAPKGLNAEPVKSRFGWHVIEVTATRTAQIPPFEAVKDQIRRRLEQRASAAARS